MPARNTPQNEFYMQEYINKHLRGQFPTSGTRLYSKATVFSMYWQADSMGCMKEARELNKLFSEKFGYKVKEFAIPSEKPYIAVFRELVKLIEEDGELGSLLIIYYGGHGDPDEKDERYGSVLTAHRVGGPELPWDHLQTILESDDTEADVLLILDCCYAAQAARNRGATSHRFQLLSAAAKGRKTPGVGDRSFTTLLIKQIRLLLAEKGFVSIPQLHRQLASRDAQFAETPIFFDMLPNEQITPMNLRPFLQVSTEPSSSVEKKPHASVTLKLTLPQGLDLDSALKITDWLRNTAPTEIGDILCTEASPPPSIPERKQTFSKILEEISKLTASPWPTRKHVTQRPQSRNQRSPAPQPQKEAEKCMVSSGVLDEISKLAASRKPANTPQLKNPRAFASQEREYFMFSSSDPYAFSRG